MTASPPRPRIPPEIKLELGSRQDEFLPRITKILGNVTIEAQKAGDPTVWLQNLQTYLKTGDVMVVQARMGRTLVGFLLLDPGKGAAPFSWVDQRFRHRGLGERFYSFACINLARPAPEFRFHKDMLDEYGLVLKSTGAQPKLQDSFYVVHENDGLTPTAQTQPAASDVPQLSESEQRPAPRRLVIDNGDWIGFSRYDARRLKLRMGRFPRLVEE